MKLCIITETYPPEINGVAMTIHRLVGKLLAAGHQILLIRPETASQDDALADAVRQNHPCLRIEEVIGLPIPLYPEAQIGIASWGQIRSALKKFNPDLVHIVTEGFLGAQGILNARSLGIPLLSSFHTNFHDYCEHYKIGVMKPVVLRYLKFIHNNTRLNLVPDQRLIKDLKHHGFKNPLYWGRGVDSDLFDPSRRSPALRHQWGAGERDPVFVHVSRLASEKNMRFLLRAYKACHEKNPACKFVVVGDGPERSPLKRFASELSLRVHFTGMLTGESLAEHYASGDIFAFPSTSETFGNVNMEAMASGLVVIAFDYASAEQFIAHRRNGFAIHCFDEKLFLKGMHHCAENLSGMAQLRSNARASILKIPWSKVVTSYLDSARRALAGS